MSEIVSKRYGYKIIFIQAVVMFLRGLNARLDTLKMQTHFLAYIKLNLCRKSLNGSKSKQTNASNQKPL